MRIAYILGGALIGGLLCYLVFYIVGNLFGPFYESEADMARNVKFFLAIELLLVFIGGFVGNMIFAKRNR